MAVQLHRPHRVRMALVDRRGRAGRRSSLRSSLVDVALRGLLLGIGIGILLRAVDAGPVSLTVAGIVALGAALASWSR
jgi:hypothetical protein